MCTLYERIQELSRKKGVSGSRMCLDLGLSKSTLSDIKSGRKKGVSTATAQKIASYFGVSVEYLLGVNEVSATSDSAKEAPGQHQLIGVDKELYELLMQIPEEQKRLFLEMGRVFVNNLHKD